MGVLRDGEQKRASQQISLIRATESDKRKLLAPHLHHYLNTHRGIENNCSYPIFDYLSVQALLRKKIVRTRNIHIFPK